MGGNNPINVALNPPGGGFGRNHVTHSSTSRLIVIVRMDLFERGSDYTPDTLPSGLRNNNHDEVRCGFDAGSAKKIMNARIEIADTGVAGLTNRDGKVELDISGLNGEYTVRIRTENAGRDPSNPTIQCIDTIAGPDLAEGTDDHYEMIFRPLELRINLRDGALESALDPFLLPANSPPYGFTHGRIGNRIHENFVRGDPEGGVDPVLPIDLRPAWFKSNAPYIAPRNNNYADITHIVVHCTGGDSDRFGSAINTAVNSDYCAHYYMDLNGHIIKVVPDKMSCGHAGASRWAGIGGVNAYSIGIELLNRKQSANRPPKPYTESQYTALKAFLHDLQGAYNSLLAHHVVGHCDIKVENNRYQSPGSWAYDNGTHGRKLDPGQHFDWERLEIAEIGMRANGQADMTTVYGGFFGLSSEESLILIMGDSDSSRKYGGRHRGDEISGNPVTELQDDLERIGYSLGPRNRGTGARQSIGSFDDHTKRAVERFQLHFRSGGRIHPDHDPESAPEGRNSRYLGKVDVETARLIKQVVGGIP